MKTFPVSATYLTSFLQCPQKFYFRYHSDKEPIGMGEARAFGTAVHEALEYMYTVLSDSGNKPTEEDYRTVVDVFMKSAIRNGVTQQELYEEGREMVVSYLDNYTTEEKVIGLEIKFGLPRNNPEIEVATDGGTLLAGAIDKLIEIDSETVAVIDYKTSRVAKTRKEAETDEQLSLYDLVVSKLYPQYKRRILVLDFLRHSPVITMRTDEQRREFGEFVDRVNAEIEALDEKDVRPRINSYCGWCDYRIYCPAYSAIINDGDIRVNPTFSLDEDGVIEEWTRLDAIKKTVDGYMRELSMQADGLIRKNGNSELRGNGGSLVLTQRTMTQYDVGTVMRTVPKEDLHRVLNVNKRALTKYMQTKPELAETIESTAQTSYASSYFRFKRNKGNK